MSQVLRISPITYINFWIGGKKFSKNLTPLDAGGNPTSMWEVSGTLSFVLVAQFDTTVRTRVMPKPSRHLKRKIHPRKSHPRKKKIRTSLL